MSAPLDPTDRVNYLRTTQALELYVRGAVRPEEPAQTREALRVAAIAIERWNLTDLSPWLRYALTDKRFERLRTDDER